jgi:hypothetical protein
LNIALVFQWTDAIGKETDSCERVKGGFKECRGYRFYFKSGLKDTIPRNMELFTLTYFDSIGNRKEQFYYNYDGASNYKININGKTEAIIYYKTDGTIKWRHTFLYDNKENIIEEILYKPDSSIDYKCIYFYDLNGKNIKWIKYNSDSLLSYCLLEYDIKGNNIEKIIFNGNGTKDYEEFTRYSSEDITKECIHYYLGKIFYNKELNIYNLSGNLIEWKYCDSADIVVGRGTYIWDKNGKMVEEDFYNFDNIVYHKRIHKYDDNGNKIEDINYDIDNHVEHVWKYKYDEKGNQIESNYYNANGLMTGRNLNLYDDYGNLVENKTFNVQENCLFGYKYIYSK